MKRRLISKRKRLDESRKKAAELYYYYPSNRVLRGTPKIHYDDFYVDEFDHDEDDPDLIISSVEWDDVISDCDDSPFDYETDMDDDDWH